MFVGRVDFQAVSPWAGPWRSYIEISRIIRRSLEEVNSPRRSHDPYFVSKSYPGSHRLFHVTVPCRQHPTGGEKSPDDVAVPQFLKDYKNTFNFPRPTHKIRDLADLDPSSGTEVVLHGYLGSRADISKKLSFASLTSKELDHSVQIVSFANSSGRGGKPSHEVLRSIEENSPVAVRGFLKPRARPKSTSGSIHQLKNVESEVDLVEIQCLNDFPKDIIATEETRFPPEQRHLQIRTDQNLRAALHFRAKVAQICRNELDLQGFLEVETPLLFKSTPEGAREFIVPTRRKGYAYALPQSPQQYKQILMASGLPKYYQIAKCFRDEDLRADRQPEFTQLDLEMSFATGEDVMQTIEMLVRRLWVDALGSDIPEGRFRRMPYLEAMEKYGSDKPDLRYDMQIHNVGYMLPQDLIMNIGPLTDPIVEVLKLQLPEATPQETHRFITSFMESPEGASFQENPEGKPGVFVVDARKPLQGLSAFGFEAAENLEELMDLTHGDILILQARKRAPLTGGSTALGNLRQALYKYAVKQGMVEAPEGFEFLWIIDFPLFSPSNDTDPGQGGAAGIASTHHPFTAPKSAEDVDLLLTDPLKVKAEHYDLVLNGVELGGGSRRIHDARVQEFVLKEVLKMSQERLQDFTHLLEILRAGCPPHAGIALGFDRLVAVMLGKDSIRDVVAFPKSGRGEDLLVKSPGVLSQDSLDTYHLTLRE